MAFKKTGDAVTQPVEVDGDELIPRRCYVEKLTPAEKTIREAMLAVEDLPADEKLTEAATLLGQALELVGDWVDAQEV